MGDSYSGQYGRGGGGITQTPGPTGPAGPGVPAGGTEGQYLKKNSSTDYDSVWATVAPGGGRGGPDLLALPGRSFSYLDRATRTRKVSGSHGPGLVREAGLWRHSPRQPQQPDNRVFSSIQRGGDMQLTRWEN